ncbi:MAG: hypothetical protein DRJ28_10005 [Actinobacteria bacterium]|nr:MAG: hypothetical protein DRJ28_10005 [Actinomycetota bacterium]
MTGSRRFADPTLQAGTTEPWEYQTDGVTASVPDAWTLQIDVTLGGDEVQVPMYVRPEDDRVFWFIDCGDPPG